MRFYLTGASSPGAHQPLPDRCLGGFVASTPLENATEGNLFGATGRQALLKRVTRHRLLALRNETGAAVAAVVLELRSWLDEQGIAATDPFFNYGLALASPATDAEGRPYFETITRDIARPYYAVFSPDSAEAITLTIPTLDAGGMVGLWLRQTPKGLPALPPLAEGELEAPGPPPDIVTQRTLALSW